MTDQTHTMKFIQFRTGGREYAFAVCECMIAGFMVANMIVQAVVSDLDKELVRELGL